MAHVVVGTPRHDGDGRDDEGILRHRLARDAANHGLTGADEHRRMRDIEDCVAEDAVCSELLFDEVGLMATRSFGY
jgi:hypothetical protein